MGAIINGAEPGWAFQIQEVTHIHYAMQFNKDYVLRVHFKSGTHFDLVFSTAELRETTFNDLTQSMRQVAT